MNRQNEDPDYPCNTGRAFETNVNKDELWSTYHGFAITKAATQTQTYRDADKAMLEEFAAMCADMREAPNDT